MPNTVQTVTSQNVSETFVGATPEEAVAAAAAKYGANAHIGEPTPRRNGGVGGFFARQTYQVLVQVNPAELQAGPALDSVDDVADLLTPAVAATAQSPLVYGRPASGSAFLALPAAPAVPADAVPEPPAAPSMFAAALAGVEKSATVEAAVQRATDQSVTPAEPFSGPVVHPVANPMAYGGQIGTHPQWPAVVPGTPAAAVQSPAAPHVVSAPTPDVHISAALRATLDGVNEALIDAAFAHDVATRGEIAAITALFGQHYRNPGLPVLDAGEVLVVVGIGVQSLTAARAVAEHVGVDQNAVYGAGGPACAGAVPAARRLRTLEDITALRAKKHKTPVVVAFDTDWSGPDVGASSMLAALGAVVTWASVDATRRDADTARWLSAHRRVEGLVAVNAEHTSASASLLSHRIPVSFLDGRPATPKRWAGLLTSGALL